MLQGQIPLRVQNGHILRYERPNRFKFGAYVVLSLLICLVRLFLLYPLRRYIAVQSACTVSRSIRASEFDIQINFAYRCCVRTR